jgi:hypothetical protein
VKVAYISRAVRQIIAFIIFQYQVYCNLLFCTGGAL